MRRCPVQSEAGPRDHRRWLGALKTELENTGAQGAEAGRYLRDHRIRISVRSQSAGARWTVGRRIEINPQYARDSVVSHMPSAW